MFLTIIFSHFCLSCFMFSPYFLKLLSFLFLLFITISLLLLALALRYSNVSSTSSGILLSTTCTRDETKYTKCIPLVEEGMEVLSTLMLEAKTKIDCPGKSFDGVVEMKEDVDKVVEVEEEQGENITQCVKSCDKIVKDDVVNEGGSNFESTYNSNVGTYKSMKKETEWKRKLACKLLQQHDVMEGEERMDSLWEIYTVLDTYQSDFKTKSAQEAAIVFEKKKKKRTRELGCNGNEDGDGQMRNGKPGCLPFKCCTRKMNLGMGRTQIVKITKALRGIDLLPLHHVMKRRAWKKGQILI